MKSVVRHRIIFLLGAILVCGLSAVYLVTNAIAAPVGRSSDTTTLLQALPTSPAIGPTVSNETCLECHGKPGLTMTLRMAISSIYTLTVPRMPLPSMVRMGMHVSNAIPTWVSILIPSSPPPICVMSPYNSPVCVTAAILGNITSPWIAFMPLPRQPVSGKLLSVLTAMVHIMSNSGQIHKQIPSYHRLN